eukprot:CAMPEP_0194266662 /NCGR_PEP_ID=MMETSP0169-20130528/1497_1 /TAXON_ID=218684 /ORGANISM="Corethron pennatum, Strain L29A3" /LENGTH=314 /DNA_ID=CAMNT_0039007405 /DNA_START=93 /DNA_END=1037 /DNA_ORIENTATION=-
MTRCNTSKAAVLSLLAGACGTAALIPSAGPPPARTAVTGASRRDILSFAGPAAAAAMGGLAFGLPALADLPSLADLAGDTPTNLLPTKEKPPPTISEEAPPPTISEEAPRATISEETPRVTTPEEAPRATIPEEAPRVTIPEEAPRPVPVSTISEETPRSTSKFGGLLERYQDGIRGFIIMAPSGWNKFEGEAGAYDVKWQDVVSPAENIKISSTPVKSTTTSVNVLGDVKAVGASLAAKRKAKLISAEERLTEEVLFYTFEFALPDNTHQLLQLCVQKGKIWSVDANSSEKRWKTRADLYASSLASFIPKLVK